jgi:hypothetical protein
MKLTEEAYHLLLGRCVISESRPPHLPYLFDRSFPIHETDEEIGSWSESLESPGGVVLKNIPELSPIIVTMDLHMAAKAWLQSCHPIPVRAVKGNGHTVLNVKCQSSNAKLIQKSRY